MISLHPIKPHFLLVCFRRRSKLLSSTRILYTTYMFILYVLLNVCLYTYTHRINIPGTSGRYLSYSAFCFVSDCIFISLRRSKSKYTFLDIYDFPRCVIKYHCNGFDLFRWFSIISNLFESRNVNTYYSVCLLSIIYIYAYFTYNLRDILLFFVNIINA